MASQVEICNLALANIHAKSINSITENTVEAQYCKLKYQFVLDFMVRSAQWNFTHKQQALALTETSLFTWVYAYQYPSDCIKLNYLLSRVDSSSASTDGLAYRPQYEGVDRGLIMGRTRVPFEVVTADGVRLIGANEPDLRIDYQSRASDPNKFDSMFIMAMAWYLAAEIALPIIGGSSGREMRSDALKMYQMTMAEALAADANEQYNGQQKDSEFILIRG
tara:strand:- start:5726 stop:6388 length:663 start_codon:yes stop_codon:yes gene_type:complete